MYSIYMYVYTCKHVHVHVCVYICTCIRTYNVHVHVHVHCRCIPYGQNIWQELNLQIYNVTMGAWHATRVTQILLSSDMAALILCWIVVFEGTMNLWTPNIHVHVHVGEQPCVCETGDANDPYAVAVWRSSSVIVHVNIYNCKCATLYLADLYFAE